MNFKPAPPQDLLQRLLPPSGPVRMVLDTDTYNEIDDQFAVVYSLLSPERLEVEAIHAAPFLNKRSEGPGDGMQKSYEEILRLLERLEVPAENFVYRGSETFIPDLEHPVESEATRDLIRRAMADNERPLYVVAIGAPTNVSSAILLEPRIIDKIIVVWLGGHPHYWPSASEFNLMQDLHASQVLFNSGVPLVQIPCAAVSSHLLTTTPELREYLRGHGRIGDYLLEIFEDYVGDKVATAKEVWDISAVAWLLNADWVRSQIVHSPILTEERTWSIDQRRHFIRVATSLDRNAIFRDLFGKIARRTTGEAQ